MTGAELALWALLAALIGVCAFAVWGLADSLAREVARRKARRTNSR
jgi:hypothetical protein